MSEAKGMSLHIGLNRVNATHYHSEHALEWCESDAVNMMELAGQCGFHRMVTLRASEATTTNVASEIRYIAAALSPRDLFLLTYSGHGSRAPFPDPLEESWETWCLFDRMLLDKELIGLYTLFKPGVRILVVSDSCFSGGMNESLTQRMSTKIRSIEPDEVAMLVEERKELYRGIASSELVAAGKLEPQCSVLLFSACEDNGIAQDGPPHNGLFTRKLLEVWQRGAFQGTYEDMHQEVLKLMPTYQRPCLKWSGALNSVFENQKPFTI